MEQVLPSGDMEAALLRHLPMIRRTIAAVSRRHQLSADDAAELAASVFVKLVEDDYVLLRRCQNTRNPKAFLFTVVYHRLLDARVQKWGRWRPSVQARRLGSAAVFLETLIVRDRTPPREALAVLEHHPRWNLSSSDARDLHARMNCPVPRQPPVSLSAVEATHPVAPAMTHLERTELQNEARRVRRTLTAAIRGLPDEDRRLLRMRFQDLRSVHDIAAALGVEVKPLYRRFERILRRLRGDLERRDLTRTVVRRLVGDQCVEFASGLPDDPGPVPRGNPARMAV